MSITSEAEIKDNILDRLKVATRLNLSRKNFGLESENGNFSDQTSNSRR